MTRTVMRAYVDGFNLYYGALRRDPALKWLNIPERISRVVSTHQLERVTYCTARIVPQGDLTAGSRQDAYLRVLQKGGSAVEVVEGKFSVRDTSAYRVNPVTCDCCHPTHVYVKKTEEKGSDVNLAVRLVKDAYEQRMSLAVLVSGDTDIQMAVDVARSQGVEVVVIDPRNRKVLDADRYIKVKRKTLLNCQFPSTVQLADGQVIHRPAEWTGTTN